MLAKVMSRQFKRSRTITGCILFVIFAIAGWFYFDSLQISQVSQTSYQWEPFFFRSINRTTALLEIDELRRSRVPEGDLEIRVWRFGIPLEGVILKRTNSVWSGTRIITDDDVEPSSARTISLGPPSWRGFLGFWTGGAASRPIQRLSAWCCNLKALQDRQSALPDPIAAPQTLHFWRVSAHPYKARD